MKSIDFTKVGMARLSSSTPGIDTFQNKKAEMVNYLQECALADQEDKIGTTWVWNYDNSIVLGYVTLAMYSIDRKYIQDLSGKYFQYRSIPALLLGQIATHKNYENRGIGTYMVSWTINKAIVLSKDVGCRMLTLHPHKDVVEWYQKLGFKLIESKHKKNIMYLYI
ncbi:MAG: GNAT family N-acetyltransferase [Thaumarchaeota archaeon]|nr:GNAT family N-acetyltransferase [Nitrososphaerota archaeon]